MTQNDINDGKITISYGRCPTCERVAKFLACSECRNSDETGFLTLCKGKLHKKSKLAGTSYIRKDVIDKFEKLESAGNEKDEFLKTSTQKLEKLTAVMQLESEIGFCLRNVKRLKQLLSARKLETGHLKATLVENKKSLQIHQNKIGKTLKKRSKLKDFIKSKQSLIQSSLNKTNSLKIELRKVQQNNISILTRCIFPLQEVKKFDEYQIEQQDKPESFDDMQALELQEALDEARRLSFVHGRWVDQQNGSVDTIQISISSNAASTPCDGDYSSYLTWLEVNHKASGSDPANVTSSLTEEGSTLSFPTVNSALGTSSALSYSAQLLNVVRKILNIHVPHSLHYSTFSNPSISPLVFTNSVKLLNSNLLSICLLQGVDGFTLHPLHTLRNLKILIEKLVHEGKTEELIVPSLNLLLSMEETLGLSDINDEDLDQNETQTSIEWQLSFESEWEAVTTPQSGTSDQATYQSANLNSVNQQSGLVSSAFSWAIKGWWGQGNE